MDKNKFWFKKFPGLGRIPANSKGWYATNIFTLVFIIVSLCDGVLGIYYEPALVTLAIGFLFLCYIKSE